ncbi:glutamine--tRNA ligase/YqeY domain fusion protein [Gammaproteobacteria bacterium]|nr:glutamine--tRNA ligase/YqeY domain fusion protein [Gammaproteobacteria bacterium]
MSDQPDKPKHFIAQIIEKDLESGLHDTIVTRFPPEPNGYLHIGHAKSICLNFGLAQHYPGVCSLRFDDTNPEKESDEYVRAIQEDVRWLGFDWQDRLHYASDYFERLYGFAEELIRSGKAFVCSLNAEQMREHRGTLTEAGRHSPDRDRSVADNLDLFARMRAGEFADGALVLRAKIDMAAANINLRDPVLYRIRRVHHHRTGDTWCIYPTYDYTHCLSDAIEAVTHSLCTLEFEDHRPLYDWVIENTSVAARPRQYEFSRLSLEHAVTSKRWLTRLVEDGVVDGWDDPRMPTIAGMRRRGFTPGSIREFCQRIGVTKSDNTIEYAVLEDAVRVDLDANAERRMAVLDPVKLIIDNYPKDTVETFSVANHPKDESLGHREVPFSREVWIEGADFMEEPVKGFFRLAPGREVRLKYAYYVTATGVDKDEQGNIIAIHADYDPASRGGGTPDNRKVKGTIHWVASDHAVEADVRLYDRLFNVADPTAHRDDFASVLNPESGVNVAAKLEPSLAKASPEQRFQFERLGYFVADRHSEDATVPRFNRTVTLRDSWGKKKG